MASSAKVAEGNDAMRAKVAEAYRRWVEGGRPVDRFGPVHPPVTGDGMARGSAGRKG